MVKCGSALSLAALPLPLPTPALFSLRPDSPHFSAILADAHPLKITGCLLLDFRLDLFLPHAQLSHQLSETIWTCARRFLSAVGLNRTKPAQTFFPPFSALWLVLIENLFIFFEEREEKEEKKMMGSGRSATALRWQ